MFDKRKTKRRLGGASKGKSGRGHGDSSEEEHPGSSKNSKQNARGGRPEIVRGWSARVVLPALNLQGHPRIRITNISASGLRRLCEELATNRDIDLLDLRYNFLGFEEMMVLSRGLASNVGMRSLDLRSNELHDSSLALIAAALRQQVGLADLILSSNNIGDKGIELLAPWLEEDTSMEVLVLKDNNIGEDGARHLTRAIMETHRLTELHLGLNLLGDAGVKSLVDGLLEGVDGLSLLDLTGNSVSNIGAKALATVLAQNRPLQRLELRNNRIRDEGMKRICVALFENKMLTHLDMSGNVLNDDCGDSIKEVFLKNCKLRHLCIEDNFFTSTSAQVWIDMLPVNEQLQLIKLDAANNKIDAKLLTQLSLFFRTHAQELREKKRALRAKQGSSTRSMDTKSDHSSGGRPPRRKSQEGSKTSSGTNPSQAPAPEGAQDAIDISLAAAAGTQDPQPDATPQPKAPSRASSFGSSSDGGGSAGQSPLPKEEAEDGVAEGDGALAEQEDVEAQEGEADEGQENEAGSEEDESVGEGEGAAQDEGDSKEEAADGMQQD
mmetsp:Transcript_40279/g.92610  ORF Transcript_40279/g.92610 Transcript_40279/m.92610 type:complete len:552 (-) Transcript_40279:39-1694(-)